MRSIVVVVVPRGRSRREWAFGLSGRSGLPPANAQVSAFFGKKGPKIPKQSQLLNNLADINPFWHSDRLTDLVM